MSHRQLIVVRIDYRQTMNCAVALNTWGNENLITTKADVTVYSRFQELLQKMNDHKQAEDWASPNSYSSSQLTSSTSVISSPEQISLWVSFTSCEYISATFQTPKNWKKSNELQHFLKIFFISHCWIRISHSDRREMGTRASDWRLHSERRSLREWRALK